MTCGEECNRALPLVVHSVSLGLRLVQLGVLVGAAVAAGAIAIITASPAVASDMMMLRIFTIGAKPLVRLQLTSLSELYHANFVS